MQSSTRFAPHVLCPPKSRTSASLMRGEWGRGRPETSRRRRETKNCGGVTPTRRRSNIVGHGSTRGEEMRGKRKKSSKRRRRKRSGMS